MKRLLIRATAVVAVVAVLVACSENAVTAKLSFSMQPVGNLGYEVDDDGQITIETRSLAFRNPAGAHGLTLTGYRIEFFDEFDEPVLQNDNVQVGSLSVFVPPGLRCPAVPERELDALDEDDLLLGRCTLQWPGVRFAPSPLVVSEASYQLLPAGIAQAHLDRIGIEFDVDGNLVRRPLPVGWHADIVFTGVTSAGVAYTSDVYRVSIAPPN